MPTNCLGRSREGNPCSARVQPGREWCPWHDPERAAERAEWSRKGGKARSNAARAKKALPAEPLTNAEVHAWMSLAFRKTLAGTMEPGVMHALSQAARTLADLTKVTEFEEQIASMRREIVDLAERRGAS